MKRNLATIFGLLMIASMLLVSCAPAATATPAAAPTEAAAAPTTAAAAPTEAVAAPTTAAAAPTTAAAAPTAAATAAPAVAGTPGKSVKIINLVNGTLGDKSFFDSAARGLAKAQADFGVNVKTIEAGIDPAKWEPALDDAAANQDYDLMIVGTYQMTDFLQKVAPQYPDKKFIIYDSPVDYTKCDCKNVYSVSYKQNEGGYLTGYYAGLMSKSKKIGAVGAQDIPVIDDFIVGYKQGAKDAGITNDVLVQYAGGWNDPAKGKEIALAEYQQGADIVFNIAGGTGDGIFQAAQELKKWAIGVDSDQATIVAATNPDQAQYIITSDQKNVDNSLYRAVKEYLAGTLPFGKAEALGVKEGGVGLSINKFYDAATPADVQAKMTQLIQDMSDGKIKVDTAIK
jgi:basic membrane protein A